MFKEKKKKKNNTRVVIQGDKIAMLSHLCRLNYALPDSSLKMWNTSQIMSGTEAGYKKCSVKYVDEKYHIDRLKFKE